MKTKSELETSLILSEKKTQQLRELMARTYNALEKIEQILEPLRDGKTPPSPEELIKLRTAYRISEEALGELHTWGIQNRI